MIGLRASINEHLQRKLKEASEKAAYRNFGHAAASIRKDVQQTIERAPRQPRSGGGRKRKRRAAATIASPPGRPPRTRRGALRRAIRFDVSKTSTVVGPVHSIVGESGAAHEFGGQYKGAEYPERSFMGPALERNISRFADSWRGSIGEQ